MDDEARRDRRERRRRELRRRRLTVVSILAVAAIALVVVIAAAGSGGSSGGHATAGGAAAKRAAFPHRSSATTPARTGPPGDQPVPVLMYHVIAPAPPGAPFPGLYVPPAEFAEQVQALEDAGWHAVTPDQVYAYWHSGVPLGPGKPIVFTFDNGYHSQYAQALPILRRVGWVAEENIQLTGLPPSQGGLGQGEVEGLVHAGWELDTQGFSHADLITLDAQQLHYQVAVARETIQRRYHVPVNWFCYPSGHYDATVIAQVKAAGYRGSTTVVPGWAHREEDPYRMHRLRVLGGTSGAQLLAELASVREDPPAPASYSGG